MSKILILGGSGFIGSRLVPRLVKAGHEVGIADIAPSPVHPELRQVCDIRDLDAVRQTCRGCDLIINLAAQHRDDVTPVSLYDEVNVQGSRHVCQVAEELGIRKIIFASSVAIYGFPQGELDEAGPATPFNDYGRTKWAAEAVYREWLRRDPAGRSLTIVRPTVVFGEGNRGNVYNLLHELASGRFVMVGSGENRKSMAYVENVAGFFQHCLGFGPGEHLYNYVDKPDLTMNTLVRMVRRQLGWDERVRQVPYAVGWLGGLGLELMGWLLGRKFAVSRIRVKKFCAETVFAASRVGQTGYRAPFTLEEGLRRTLEYEFPRRANGA